MRSLLQLPGRSGGVVTTLSGGLLVVGGLIGLLFGLSDGPTIISTLAEAGLVTLAALRFDGPLDAGSGDQEADGRVGHDGLPRLLAEVDRQADPVIGDLAEPWPALVKELSSGIAARRFDAVERAGENGASDGPGPDLRALAVDAVADARATIEAAVDEVARATATTSPEVADARAEDTLADQIDLTADSAGDSSPGSGVDADGNERAPTEELAAPSGEDREARSGSRPTA